jgi:hypothetical protein
METGEERFDGRHWPLERLEREIGELAAHIHAATCRWLLLVAEFDRREGWADWGCKSCAHWLSWQCSLAPSAAREQVRVARRLAELPLTRAAFGRGELSYSQVRALSRAATAELEPTLLELARFSTASQLERTLRAYRGVVERDVPPEERAHGESYLACEHDADGFLVFHGRLPAEEGALVTAALEAARDSLRAGPREDAAPRAASTPNGYRSASAEAEMPPEDAADPRPEPSEPEMEPIGPVSEGAAPSNAAALVLMAETLLSSGPAERSGGDSYQVVVHVDSAALSSASTDEDADSLCQLEHGHLLHPETARRLACDASIVRILERDGRPLSVGRRTRSVPPALRRALHARDHCCRFPGCTQRRFLHAHHIEHWAHGGPTDLGNLVHLCRFHHRLVHEGGYTLESVGRTGELRFRRPDGTALNPVPTPVPGRRGEVERRNRGRGIAVDQETCASGSTGERFHLALCVDALVTADPRLAEPSPPCAAPADQRSAAPASIRPYP